MTRHPINSCQPMRKTLFPFTLIPIHAHTGCPPIPPEKISKVYNINFVLSELDQIFKWKFRTYHAITISTYILIDQKNRIIFSEWKWPTNEKKRGRKMEGGDRDNDKACSEKGWKTRKKDRRKRVATLRWLKYPEAFFPTKRKERRTRLVVGHFSLCRKIDELCPYNGNKRVEQRGTRGWMLGFEGGKQQAGLGNGKEHNELGVVVVCTLVSRLVLGH